MVSITWQAYKKEDLQGLNTQCLIATVAWTGYDIDDRVVKVNNHNTSTGALQTANPSYFLNVTTDTQLATAPTAAQVVSDFKPCDQKVDVEFQEKYHTDTTTWEITEVYEVTLFDSTWAVVWTPYYILADWTWTVFTTTWTIADEPIRVVIGSELVSIDDTAAVSLTVPDFAAGSHIQVHLGNDIKFAVWSTVPTTTLNGNGTHVAQWQEIILHSNLEVNTFSAIAVDNMAAAELYVEYYNTSIETGI